MEKRLGDVLQTTPVIFVDVDDTLVRSFGTKRMVMGHMVRLVRELSADGVELYCWSSGGAEYAREVATDAGLESCFRAFLPKPHLLLDDVQLSGWRLLELHPTECTSMTAAEVLAKLRSARAGV